MLENILNPDNPTEVTSANNFKTCKTCKKSTSSISEYKMHIKEHRQVCRTFRYDNINKIIICCYF